MMMIIIIMITLLNMIDHKFDIIAISGKGGTMIYVATGHNFQPRKDLEIYQSKDLESTFIEVINPKESNDIVGVIYRHPNMGTTVFTDHKLNDLMLKLSLERNKKIYIVGDFYFDLKNIHSF